MLQESCFFIHQYSCRSETVFFIQSVLKRTKTLTVYRKVMVVVCWR